MRWESALNALLYDFLQHRIHKKGIHDMSLGTLVIQNVEVVVDAPSIIEGIGVIATAFAAIFAGVAARATRQAANAAEKSTEQWKQQALFDKYIDKQIIAKSRLPWVVGAIEQPCNLSFDLQLNLSTEQLLTTLQYGTPKLDSRQQRLLQRYKRIIE